MATDTQMGYESGFYVNTNVDGSGDYNFDSPTWTEIALAREVTKTDNIDKQDSTSRQTARLGYKASNYGLSEAGFSFESLVPSAGETDTAYQTLKDAQTNRKPVDVLHVEGGVISTDGLDATRMICGVYGGERKEPLEDNTTVSFELGFIQNSDQTAPQTGTTSSSAFVAGS
jgi:hypothetical protein